MSKRGFRSGPYKPAVKYPTLDEFDSGRRQFLARLGAAALGAAGLGALLSGCGERAVGDGKDDPPMPNPDGGIAPRFDARRDEYPHNITDGLPRMPDARQDGYPNRDAYGGVPADMQARLDAGAPPPPPPPFKDSSGVAPMIDARLDPPADGGEKESD